MQWCTVEHAKYLKAKDTEFIVLLTWQQLKCQHEVISLLIVFPKNIRGLIYVYYNCDRGLYTTLLPQWHYVFSLILQPPEKNRKIYWIMLPLHYEICYYFCSREQILSMGFKRSNSIKYLSKKSDLFMPL